jgi:hypothetical protein
MRLVRRLDRQPKAFVRRKSQGVVLHLQFLRSDSRCSTTSVPSGKDQMTPCLLKNNKAFVGLIGLVLTALITGFLFYFVADVYWKSSVTAAPETLNAPAGQSQMGVSVSGSTHQSVLDSTVKQIRAIEKQQLETADKMLTEGVERASQY